MQPVWCLLVALAAVDAAAYGGPPPAEVPSGDREPQPDLPLPGKEVESVPAAALQSEPLELVRFVYADSVPLRSTFYELRQAIEPPVEGVDAAATPAAGGSASTGGIRDRIKNLASKVTSWLPDLSAYMPHLPNYLPGLDLELEAHPHPLKVPHIPGPSELLRDFNALFESAMEKLHRKHEEIAELVKCTTPIPQQCQSLFQDFAKPPGLPSGPGAPPATTSDGKPILSFYAGFTKPEGPPHGVGFYVDDKYRPHLGHAGHPPPAVVPQKLKEGENATGVEPGPADEDAATPASAGASGEAPAEAPAAAATPEAAAPGEASPVSAAADSPAAAGGADGSSSASGSGSVAGGEKPQSSLEAGASADKPSADASGPAAASS